MAESDLGARHPVVTRCFGGDSPLYQRYHDEEWGVPVHDDRALFEFLILEGAQAGLSWSTILNKRENYRRLFDDFDPQRVARFTPKRVERLLADPGIVRHRLKVEGAVKNARLFLALQEEHGSFDAYVWQFVAGEPIHGRWRTLRHVPTTTAESDALSKDLRRRGFTFVGSTIMYAFMQAVGMVNDHIEGCFRREEVGRLATRESQPAAVKHRTTVERKSERELVVTRRFDGPARLVFEAWTRPELLKRWWAPKSTGMTLLSCETDVRVGGKYRLEFGHGDSTSMAFYGRYLEVIPHSRLVWTNDESDDGAVTTVTFEDKGGQTLQIMHERYPSKEALDAAIAGMEGGMAETFAQLDELLDTLGASAGRA